MSDLANLTRAGLRATPSRLKILELLRNQPDRHLSADDIYRLLVTDAIQIGFATVYRAVDQLEKVGLLIRHNFYQGRAVYELNDGRIHSHLVCLDCGSVSEFKDDYLEKRRARIAEKHGYVLAQQSLTIYCRCAEKKCAHR